MKKTIAFLLILIIILSCVTMFCSCDNNNSGNANNVVNSEENKLNEEETTVVETTLIETTTEKDDTEYVINAYEALNKAFVLTSSAMSDIYKSWYFIVYECNKYNSSGYYFGNIDIHYASYIGRDYSVIVDTFKRVYGKDCTASWFKAAMSKVSTGVPFIIQILKDEGIYSSINVEMEKAKEALKNVNNDNACYNDLMSYYTELLSYYEFAKSPSGSFSGLESTIGSYEKNIQNYKNRISIYID